MLSVYVLVGEIHTHSSPSTIIGVYPTFDEAKAAAPESHWDQLEVREATGREWSNFNFAGTTSYEHDEYCIIERPLGTVNFTPEQVELISAILRGESGPLDALTDIINRG